MGKRCCNCAHVKPCCRRKKCNRCRGCRNNCCPCPINPARPLFAARALPQTIPFFGLLPTQATVNYTQVLFNTIGYDGINTFTAPVAGTYNFAASAAVTGAVGVPVVPCPFSLQLAINGVVQPTPIACATVVTPTANLQLNSTVQLNAGDRVTVVLTINTAVTTPTILSGTFSGTLITNPFFGNGFNALPFNPFSQVLGGGGGAFFPPAAGVFGGFNGSCC